MAIGTINVRNLVLAKIKPVCRIGTNATGLRSLISHRTAMGNVKSGPVFRRVAAFLDLFTPKTKIRFNQNVLFNVTNH